MKKIFLVVLLFLLVIGSISLSVSAENEYNLMNQGESSENYAHFETLNRGDSVVVAFLNGEPYEIEHCKEFLEMCLFIHEGTTIHQNIKYMVEQEVIVREAIKNGIVVSDGDVWELIEKQMELRAMDETDELAIEDQQMFHMLGVTEEEFYQMFFENYRDMLIVGRYNSALYDDYLYDAIVERSKERGDDLTTAEIDEIFEQERNIYNEELKTKFWEQYNEEKERLIAEANIVYVDGFGDFPENQ